MRKACGVARNMWFGRFRSFHFAMLKVWPADSWFLQNYRGRRANTKLAGVYAAANPARFCASAWQRDSAPAGHFSEGFQSLLCCFRMILDSTMLVSVSDAFARCRCLRAYHAPLHMQQSYNSMCQGTETITSPPRVVCAASP